MPRQTKVQQFRDTATDEQWQKLVTDHDALSKKDFEEKYGFSWNSVLNDASEKGLYEKKKKYSSPAPATVNPDGRKPFYVAAYTADIEKKSRSVQLRSDIQARLKALESDNNQYTAFAVLNQLLDEALAKYGY